MAAATAELVKVESDECQTDAGASKFFVNSGSEMFRNGDYLVLSSMDISELARRKGFDWLTVCHYNNANESEEAKRWFDAIAEEWEVLYKKYLDKSEYAFAKKVLAFQEVVDFGRFRVYGALMNEGDSLAGKGTSGERIVVVTEFMDFVNNNDLWSKVLEIKKSTDAKLWVMSEEGHSDHCIKNYGKPTQEDVFGPRHGEMERQVELSWRIENMSIEDFKNFLKTITEATEPIWSTGGVGIC
jgi:hypothetical protein